VKTVLVKLPKPTAETFLAALLEEQAGRYDDTPRDAAVIIGALRDALTRKPLAARSEPAA